MCTFQYRILAGACWNAVCGNNTNDGDESRGTDRSPRGDTGGDVHTHLLGPGARTSISYTDMRTTETRVCLIIAFKLIAFVQHSSISIMKKVHLKE